MVAPYPAPAAPERLPLPLATARNKARILSPILPGQRMSRYSIAASSHRLCEHHK